MDIIPIFYSDSSKRAINTWAEEKDFKEGGPQSILTLCKQGNLKQCVFVSDTFYDYPLALRLTEKAGIQLIFGLELLMCPDRRDHSENSVNQNHRIIVFGKSAHSYRDLIKLYSAYRTDKESKYYKYRCDDQILNDNWSNNLTLALPFFDNFIAQNYLHYGANIIPKLPTEDITIFREVNTEHPHEELINSALNEFNKDKRYREQKTKTVFYEKREDIDAYTNFRAVQNDGSITAKKMPMNTSWHDPQVPFLCSNSFCFEDWRELTK